MYFKNLFNILGRFIHPCYLWNAETANLPIRLRKAEEARCNAGVLRTGPSHWGGGWGSLSALPWSEAFISGDPSFLFQIPPVQGQLSLPCPYLWAALSPGYLLCYWPPHQSPLPWLLLLFPSLLSYSSGSSQDVFTLTVPTLWVTTLIPTAPILNVLTATPPNLYLLDKLLPCALGPCIQSSFCPEMNPSHALQNPLLILHLTSVMRSAIHHPPRNPGIALAASLSSFPLRVNQSPSLVTPASLLSLKSTHFSLFPLQLPCFRSPSAPAWITAETISEPLLGLQPHPFICSYPAARANLIMSLPD